MKKITLYIGLNDQNTKKQEISTEKAIELVADIIGDCSIEQLQGIYTHAGGCKIIEKTLKITVFADYSFNGLILNKLKQALNQETVLIETVNNVIAQFA